MNTYPFTIGNYHALVISDGGMPVTREFFLANTPDPITQQFPEEFHAPLNFIHLEVDNEHILIDAGFGAECEDAGQLIQALDNHGITRDDIDHVILTHGHLDHIGGAVSEGKPSFPNADYYLHAAEWEMWASRPSSKEHEILSNLGSSINIIQEDIEILPGIKLFLTPGHTNGHLAVMIHSEDEKLLVVSDILSDPRTLNHPSSHIGLEISPEQGRETRKDIIEYAEQQGLMLFVCHYPFPGLGYIEQDHGTYKWKAK
ncbi:MBL fold metallo-hydrolase [Halobacillus kuroshimensis]|uniref:MBL fold metallo-hydrolase n=1 Tax=Halobacillus kuroshimensis TaxID=302481 RepID=UPI000407C441|nr:MBL fold metallo-hydrolase [Halobacillus kuroshimensis]